MHYISFGIIPLLRIALLMFGYFLYDRHGIAEGIFFLVLPMISFRVFIVVFEITPIVVRQLIELHDIEPTRILGSLDLRYITY